MAHRTLFDGSSHEPPPADVPRGGAEAGGGADVVTVSELVVRLKARIEPFFGGVWVSGELAEFRGRAASGHAYFALKDAATMLRAKMWRSSVDRLRFTLENGMAVVVRANVEIYAPRGDLSLIVDRVMPKGIGEAAIALEQIRKKLLAEGLFAAERKRPLPFLPRRIGLVTSREAAAARDFLRHLHERLPVRVLLAPTPVQGIGAEVSIAAAIGELSAGARDLGIDAVVVVRGGGGIEDLAAFNSEIVARAIAACSVPVVTGIGHEIDTTIADLVADRRAKTPTDAASVVVPDRAAIRRDLQHLRDRMAEAVDHRLAAREAEWLQLRRSSAMASPAELVESHARGLRHEARLLRGAVDRRLLRGAEAVGRLRSRLAGRSPRAALAEQRRRLEGIGSRLRTALRTRLADAERRVGVAAASLEGASPVAILARGYSLARKKDDRRLLVDARDLSAGDLVETRLASGSFTSRVEEVRREPVPE